jgi:hypothetical protein
MHTWPGHDGVTIAGDSWGDPDGPLVLFQRGRTPVRGLDRMRPGHHLLRFGAALPDA